MVVALQKRDQDLLNALSLVKATKEELQEMRNDGWEELISKVMEICNKHDIDVPDLDALCMTSMLDVPEVVVRHQLQNYVRNVRCDPKFAKLKGLSDLCAKLVETKKCNTFYIVYRLLKLALVLPVATASVKHV
ncbi:hypothetical protein HKD37_18G052004 [Glycine soja]